MYLPLPIQQQVYFPITVEFVLLTCCSQSVITSEPHWAQPQPQASVSHSPCRLTDSWHISCPSLGAWSKKWPSSSYSSSPVCLAHKSQEWSFPHQAGSWADTQRQHAINTNIYMYTNTVQLIRDSQTHTTSIHSHSSTSIYKYKYTCI